MKKFLLGGLIVVLIAVSAGGGYIWWMWHSATATANQMYETKGGAGQHQTIKATKPISLLLLGVDERKNDTGRSDTIIAMTLNPKTNTVQMISIPRDTRTEIVGNATIDKINAAYAYGGIQMAENTVSNFVGNIPFDFYIKINMQGMSDLVNAIGGVGVNNPIAWTDEGYYKKGYQFKKGKIFLKDGAMAMGFARMRHLDPQGDLGRNQRQRILIMAIINKMASVSSLTRYNQLLQAIGSNVKTNMTFDDMKNVALNYRNTRKHTINYEVNETPQQINGVDYLVASDAEKQKIHNMIQKQLGQQ
jgi:cell envelope-related function transcriptional attenuator common domain